MTHQALSLEEIPLFHAPKRTFSQRFGYLGTCVLPAEVLDDTTLADSETGLTQPSLRQRCSRDDQFCYAHVLYSFVEGLYWADVAGTPDLAGAERVALTEAHLVYALAWDERLFWRTPAQILRLMQAQAEDLAPLHSPSRARANRSPVSSSCRTAHRRHHGRGHAGRAARGVRRAGSQRPIRCARPLWPKGSLASARSSKACSARSRVPSRSSWRRRPIVHLSGARSTLSALVEAREALAAADPPARGECRAYLGHRKPGLAWALTLGVPQALLAAA